jgi:hypothetical protein
MKRLLLAALFLGAPAAPAAGQADATLRFSMPGAHFVLKKR